METVEVLVRIPKREFEELQGNYVWWGKHGEYIKKGTVLPKGHDALLDARQLMNYCHNQIEGHRYVDCNVIARFPCVVKADKESEDIDGNS